MLDKDGIPHAPKTIQIRKPYRYNKPSSGPSSRIVDLGHLRPVLQKGLMEKYLEWGIKEKDDYVVWLGTKPHVVVIQPTSLLKVIGRDDTFIRNAHPTEFLFGKGLLRLEGKPWKWQRDLLSVSFKSNTMDGAVSIIQEECDQLIQKWKVEGTVRPNRDLSFLMMKILGKVIFGFDFDAKRHSGSSMHRALAILASSAPLFHLLPPVLVKMYYGRNIKKALALVNTLSEEILQHGKAPVIEALKEARSNGKLDDNQVRDHIRGLLIAGHETSATAASWSVAMLAQHPLLAETVAQEHSFAYNAKTTKDVSQLIQANHWSKETMRLYPPVPISISKSTKDTYLGNMYIPAGTRVDICSYAIHRLPWLWSRPNEFLPQRFENKVNRGTFLPYLHGPHTCLGIRLAEIEVPLVTARLAGAFRLELPQGPPKANFRLSLHPSKLLIKVKSRK